MKNHFKIIKYNYLFAVFVVQRESRCAADGAAAARRPPRARRRPPNAGQRLHAPPPEAVRPHRLPGCPRQEHLQGARQPVAELRKQPAAHLWKRFPFN